MQNNEYLSQRRNKKKQQLRFRLGILQMIYRPLWNLYLIPIIASIWVIWTEKDKVYTLFDVPRILFPVIKYSSIFLVVLIYILLICGLIEAIGNFTARKDEGDVEEAFEIQDLRNGCPILMNKKRINGSNVTMREFYSNIPMKRWVEKMDDIADSMNVHFIEKIKYGGKSNGKRIVIYTAPSRETTIKDNLYDEEL